jgi:hypothetical protein
MMNRKETIYLAMVGMALLATVMTMSSPTQALALGHWNLDEDSTPNSGLAEDGMDSSGTTDNTNGEENDSDEGSASATADDGEEESSEDGTNSNNQDSSNVAYEEFQGCLSDVEGEGSPTEQEVQDCIESSYSGIDSNENSPTESTDEDENGVNEDGSTDEGEDSEA